MNAWATSIDAQAERDLAAMAQLAHGRRDVARIAEVAHEAGCEIPSVELIDASTIKPEPVRWLWPGWLARGKLHVIAGAPGTGKTTAALSWCASITSGSAFPDGTKPDKSGRVLIWSGEDDPADTLVPRLQAAGADLAHVQFVGEVSEDGKRFAFDPARDVQTLAAALANGDGIALIVIDPLVSAVAGDSHKNAEVRRGLQPLVDLSGRVGAALLGVTHYTKGTQGRDPLERVTGSIAFGALARLVFGTVRQKVEDDDSPPRYLLARVKNNLGPDGGGFVYRFEQADNGAEIITNRIAWGEAVAGPARVLMAEAEAEPDDEEGHDAASFLRDLLAARPVPTKEVFREAEGAGFSRYQMKRAKAKLGAAAVKHGMAGGWTWQLPNREARKSSIEGREGNTQNRPHSLHPSAVTAPPSNAVEVDDL
ncbi:MAG: AAA family ATPase [Rhodanobacteraceae bacterium]